MHTTPTNLHPLPLHAALPISTISKATPRPPCRVRTTMNVHPTRTFRSTRRLSNHIAGATSKTGDSQSTEEHTSELQSRQYLVCRLLLEKKKKKKINSL